jgi:hypothetical protein
MQCETRWRAVLASFRERYEKVKADHSNAMKEMDLLRASVVQMGHLVRYSSQVNKSGTKWKQLADGAEADSHIPCKFLDGHEIFTG